MADKPVLRLVIRRPKANRVQGGGGPRKILQGRYAARRDAIIACLDAIIDGPRHAWHAGRVLLFVHLDGRSLATSHEPRSLFDRASGFIFTAPWISGYVIEATEEAIKIAKRRVRGKHSDAVKADVSRITRVDVLADVLAKDASRFSRVWNAAEPDTRGIRRFILGAAPFRHPAARDSIVSSLGAASGGGRLQFGANSLLLPAPAGAPAASMTADVPGLPAGLAPAILARYPRDVSPKIIATVPTIDALRQLTASGAIIKWEGVSPLRPMRVLETAEPEPDFEPLTGEPIVGLIDGGIGRSRYRQAVAWRAPDFVDTTVADQTHARRVAALLVEAHSWTRNADLPQLRCRIGEVQAVPRRGTVVDWDLVALLRYLDQVFAQRASTTRVWNISANLDGACDPTFVSDFSHELSKLARRHGILLVQSVGNRNGSDDRIAPPADAEAAISVAGRAANLLGEPDGPCTVSRVGFGPDGMIKPEASALSKHVVYGAADTGSSFGTPLVSRTAAHLNSWIEEPTPDLLKALLLSAGDRSTFSRSLGFGSPIRPSMPWNTAENAVTFCWTGDLRSGFDYYWNGIEVPEGLIVGDHFKGRARLVCILAPTCQTVGANYFSTRISTQLRFRHGKGWAQLAGGLALDTPEHIARAYDSKWQPVRVYEYSGRGTGLSIKRGTKLQLHARLFWRDKYVHPGIRHKDVSHPVAIAVTFESHDPSQPIHSRFVELMGERVTSAVIQPEIRIDRLNSA